MTSSNERIAVIGAGTMGRGIAQVFAPELAVIFRLRRAAQGGSQPMHEKYRVHDNSR